MLKNKKLLITKETLENIYSAKEMLVNCQDEYNVGMYNGIEYVLATIEKREPDYFVSIGDKMEAEQEETKQRTVASGIKRR